MTTYTRQTTLKDVAREVRFSVATVSMALNRAAGYERIPDETRATILAAAQRLDYKPHLIAQALKKRKSMQIALATPNIYHPFTPQLIDSVGGALRRSGYSLLLLDFTDTTRAEAVQTIERLKRGGIDGILLHSMSRVLAEATYEIPYKVYIDEKSVTPSVWFDAESATRQLTRHFFDQGVYDIAYVGSDDDLETFSERENGFRAAYAERGVALDDARILRVPPTYAGGEEAYARLSAPARRPRAVITYTDSVAHVLSLRLCRDGVRVPDDVALASVDDVPLSSLMVPALTCARIPAYELGERAVRMLLRQMDGETPRVSETLPVSLEIRASSLCAPS